MITLRPRRRILPHQKPPVGEEGTRSDTSRDCLCPSSEKRPIDCPPNFGSTMWTAQPARSSARSGEADRHPQLHRRCADHLDRRGSSGLILCGSRQAPGAAIVRCRSAAGLVRRPSHEPVELPPPFLHRGPFMSRIDFAHFGHRRHSRHGAIPFPRFAVLSSLRPQMLVSASGRSRFSRRFLLPSPLADGHARAPPSRGEERKSAKFGQHHGPGGRFRDGGDRPKSPPVSPSMPSVKKGYSGFRPSRRRRKPGTKDRPVRCRRRG